MGPIYGNITGHYNSKLAAKVGQDFEIIVDDFDKDGATCRTQTDAPEIDGNHFLNEGVEKLSAGDIVSVKVNEDGEYDL